MTCRQLCLLVHTVFLYLERENVYIFGHCRRLFTLFGFFLVAQVAVQLTKPKASIRDLETMSAAIQTFSTIVFILSAVFVPRRPDVYFNGNKVDGMRTGSLFSRYTYYWTSIMLKTAKIKGYLDEEDIPVLDRPRRAERLQEEFNTMTRSPHLYRHIIRAHWRILMRIATTTVVSTCVTFTPPIILNQLLKCLERRDKGEDTTSEARLWVSGLAVLKLFEAVILQYKYWICFMGLLIPIRTQLSAVVFSKTMRKKDVKGTQKEKENSNPGPADAEEDGKAEDEDEDELSGTKQGATNLLSVDSERIALFTAMSNVFVECVVGGIFGFSFIVIILGFVLQSYA